GGHVAEIVQCPGRYRPPRGEKKSRKRQTDDRYRGYDRRKKHIPRSENGQWPLLQLRRNRDTADKDRDSASPEKRFLEDIEQHFYRSEAYDRQDSDKTGTGIHQVVSIIHVPRSKEDDQP